MELQGASRHPLCIEHPGGVGEMSGRQTREQLLGFQEIVAAPSRRACEDQTFEIPVGVYVAMGLMFAGFIAVLSFAFSDGHMAVGYGIIFTFLGAFFAVPALFPAMAPQSSKALSWFDFRHRGIATATGSTSAREATILVLILPFLILCFGIAVAVIAQLV
jgi:hypothetical protein